MNRRSFLRAAAAVVAIPFVPVPPVVRAESAMSLASVVADAQRRYIQYRSLEIEWLLTQKSPLFITEEMFHDAMVGIDAPLPSDVLARLRTVEYDDPAIRYDPHRHGYVVQR